MAARSCEKKKYVLYYVSALVAILAFSPYIGRGIILLHEAEFSWGVLIAGFLAQLVDGSLGMGYGITSATILTQVAGLSPKTASSAVHLAQLGTTAVSGFSHRRCGHTHTPTLRLLIPAGILGALVGSMLLASLATATSKLATGMTLFAVGTYVFFRFALTDPVGLNGSSPNLQATRYRFLALLGFSGGCVDAMGGGGWGPVTTSGLLAEGRLPPSLVIGSVSLSEFFVTVAAVTGFVAPLLTAHGMPQSALQSSAAIAVSLRLDMAATLLVGGLLAAPIAPLLVQRVAPRPLGMLVGAFICLTNARVPLKLAAQLHA